MTETSPDVAKCPRGDRRGALLSESPWVVLKINEIMSAEDLAETPARGDCSQVEEPEIARMDLNSMCLTTRPDCAHGHPGDLAGC